MNISPRLQSNEEKKSNEEKNDSLDEYKSVSEGEFKEDILNKNKQEQEELSSESDKNYIIFPDGERKQFDEIDNVLLKKYKNFLTK